MRILVMIARRNRSLLIPHLEYLATLNRPPATDPQDPRAALASLQVQDVIATEKVQVNVGRPRLWLKLGADRLRDIEASDLSDAVQEMLASTTA